MHLIPVDLENLRKARYYVAGFTDASVEQRYDGSIHIKLTLELNEIEAFCHLDNNYYVET